MNISFLQAPVLENSYAFQQWLEGQGFSFDQIADIKDVVADEESYQCHRPVIAQDSNHHSIKVYDTHFGNLVEWSSFYWVGGEHIENGVPAVQYWVAVSVPDQEVVSGGVNPKDNLERILNDLEKEDLLLPEMPGLNIRL